MDRETRLSSSSRETWHAAVQGVAKSRTRPSEAAELSQSDYRLDSPGCLLSNQLLHRSINSG